MVHLDVFTEALGFLRAFDRVVFLLLFGLGLSLHTKENHLLLTHLLDRFASKNCTNAALYNLGRLLFLFLFSGSLHLAIVHTLTVLGGLELAIDLLERVQVTSTTLSTSLVLLDKTDGGSDFEIKSERVISNFLDGLSRIETFLEDVIDLGFFLVHGENLFLGTVIVGTCLLFLTLALLFPLTLLLFFSITLNLFLEDEVDWDLIVFLKVAWNRDFNDRWVILEIKK